MQRSFRAAGDRRVRVNRKEIEKVIRSSLSDVIDVGEVMGVDAGDSLVRVLRKPLLAGRVGEESAVFFILFFWGREWFENGKMRL